MASKRPKCVNCGNRYMQRATKTEVVKWREGEPKPEYRGNGIVTKETMAAKAGSLGEGQISGVSFSMRDNVMYREIWDGESYFGGYTPFCTLRCALDYARRAYLVLGPKGGK